MTENNNLPQNNKMPDWMESLPPWARLLVQGGAVAGMIYLAREDYKIKEAQRQRKMQEYANKAEEEVSELISLEYNEAISILRDSLPRMEAEYWKFFEAKLSSSATSYKIRNILERAREIRGSTTNSQQ